MIFVCSLAGTSSVPDSVDLSDSLMSLRIPILSLLGASLTEELELLADELEDEAMDGGTRLRRSLLAGILCARATEEAGSVVVRRAGG